MTDTGTTQTATAAAELEPAITGALELLKTDPDAPLAKLAAQVAVTPEVPLAAEAQPFPELPKHVELTDEARQAMEGLIQFFNSVELNVRRPLTQAEIDKLTAEQLVIALIAGPLGKRHEAIKEIIRVHMDARAEEDGIAVPKDKLGPDGEVIVAATPRDQNGHYLLGAPKQPYQVASGDMAWCQDYKNASAPAPSDAELQQAYEAADIERPVYLAITREVRVFDKAKFMLYLRKEPKKALAALRRITRTGSAQSALGLRKQS